MAASTRILSGIRPTGGIHIGNYLGSLKQWIELSQESNTDCFFMIADYHALLSFRETPLEQASFDLLAWELASGLDSSKVTLFLQSQVPAHTELAWIFNTLVTVPELGRMTQYKDLVHHGLEKPNAALFTYPVLQAADILLYKATLVPVGEDQLQHIELTRTIAKRFNMITKTETFPEPKARLTESSLIASLHDPGKKMAKSLPQGALLLEDDETTLRSKIMRAVTDAGPEKAPFPDEVMTQEAFSPEQKALLFEHMTPGVRNLFLLLQEVGGDAFMVDSFLHNYRNQTLKYSELKSSVADAVVAFILPLQAKYRTIRSDETTLKAILNEGDAKANTVANATLGEAKQAFKLVT
jgi:tryptophanyl-tRNA synthetase